MNDIGIAFPVFDKAMKLIRRGTDLNVREISGIAIVLENDDFVIEIKPKKVQDDEAVQDLMAFKERYTSND